MVDTDATFVKYMNTLYKRFNLIGQGYLCRFRMKGHSLFMVKYCIHVGGAKYSLKHIDKITF